MKKATCRYIVRDIEMLLAAAVIVENAIDHKELLQAKRSAWKDPFFEQLRLEVAAATSNLLGMDTAARLKAATAEQQKMRAQVMADLAEFKVQVEECFRHDEARKREVLQQLGFDHYRQASRNRSQDALVALLYALKSHLTGDLAAHIEAAGTDAALMQRVMSHADTVKAAEVAQEARKGERPLLTAGRIRELNHIYNTIIGICRIASTFSRQYAAIPALFSFRHIVSLIRPQVAAARTAAGSGSMATGAQQL